MKKKTVMIEIETDATNEEVQAYFSEGNGPHVIAMKLIQCQIMQIQMPEPEQ